MRLLELTGDLVEEEGGSSKSSLEESHLILATPEKWDAVSRRANAQLVTSIQLFLIDEVHLLSDDDRQAG